MTFSLFHIYKWIALLTFTVLLIMQQNQALCFLSLFKFVHCMNLLFLYKLNYLKDMFPRNCLNDLNDLIRAGCEARWPEFWIFNNI